MDAPPGRCAVAQGLTACRQARVRPEPRVWARGPSAQRPPARCLLGRRWREVGPGRWKESPRDLRGLLRDHWSLGFGDNGGKLLSAEKRGEQTRLVSQHLNTDLPVSFLPGRRGQDTRLRYRWEDGSGTLPEAEHVHPRERQLPRRGRGSPGPSPFLRKQVSGNKLAGLCGTTPSSPVGDGGTATRDVTPRACDEDGLHAKREGGA